MKTLYNVKYKKKKKKNSKYFFFYFLNYFKMKNISRNYIKNE